ncbi:protein of unknown function [Candidatus Promineifilum breve]|uniref:Uncharacterized protein n=2 Tax=Candidatus Promineifilum breve TaxID=1806508 RepID=A0A160T3V4_9CHLR|nr:protein of unknown function [Candidatus Promineifilum breve]
MMMTVKQTTSASKKGAHNEGDMNMLRKKLAVLGLSALMITGLLGSAAVSFAQTDTPAESTEEVIPESTTVVPSRGGSRLGVDDEALAAALGITVDELDAAQEAARIALIDQAVADGHLTAEEGETMKTDGSRLHHSSQYGYDKDEFLAAALGITVDELNAAELTAYQTMVAAAVEAGTLTQEQADLLLARKAAQSYLDTDALNATVRAAYAEALAEAVAAGDITQAQADALLAQLETQTFDFGFGGHGGRGGHGGGRGGRGGSSLDTLPETTPETTPDTTTDTSLDA